MKLIIAIVRDDDGTQVMRALTRAGNTVTKMSTTGGFLKAGNTTLLIGTQDENVESITNIIKSKCAQRKKIITSTTSLTGVSDYVSSPIEVDVGGATIFVLDVEHFEKI